MNYWHMQLHPNKGEEVNRESVIEIISDKGVIGLSAKWENDRGQPKKFSDEIKIGDIVLIRSKGPLALVRVKGSCIENEEKDDVWFELKRSIEIISLEGDFYKEKFKEEHNASWTDNLYLPTTIEAANNSKFIKFWYETVKPKNLMDDLILLLKYKNQIILQGPPGTGKTRQAKLIAEELTKPNDEAIASGEYKIIQFHPAYSYEDFVRGIVAETTESGNVSYQVKNKILADFAQKATNNPNGNYVLIIDEINRANLPSVLGELIYALEYRNEPVTSMYEYEDEREITLPKNLFIIGTMNTADRSVGHIDYAIRRRFAFVDILPDENVIKNAIAKTLFNDIKTLFGSDFLSPDFKAKDVMIGHSYFLVKDADELRIKLEFEIKPILREYLKDGIFLEIANNKIERLNV